MFGRKPASTQTGPINPYLMTMPFAELRKLKADVDAAVMARTEDARASFAQQLED